MIKKYLPLNAVLATCLLALSGCSSSPEEEVVVANAGIESLYETAKEQIDTGNFNAATATLEAIDSRYPFGPLSHQVQLDLIYVYYKTGNTDKALANIDRFVRLNPNHSDVDYAMYMRGLANMDTEQNLFQDYFGIDRSDRDPSNSRVAFEDFRKLLERFPNSEYAADARTRMQFIKNRLAQYEIHVARYYMKRKAYVAAANRGQYVVEYFPNSPHVQQALELMVECYQQLGLQDLKNHTLQTLRLNFPDSQIEG